MLDRYQTSSYIDCVERKHTKELKRMSYTELQAALKDLRDNHGVELQTKLAGKGVTKATLQAEYDRVKSVHDESPTETLDDVLVGTEAVLTVKPAPVKTVFGHSFKAMVPAQPPQRKAKGFTVKSRKVSSNL